MIKKFRAWHISDIEKGAPTKFEQTLENGSLFFVSDSIRYSFEEPFIEDGWILEECLLTDSEGNEVYEGDIIEFDSWLYEHPVRKEVFDKFRLDRDLFDLSGENLRVIGNKWENNE